MALLANAQMTVASAPGTGAVTLGAAASTAQTWAAAGATSGQVYSYRIEDGTKWEFGVGTYTASGSPTTYALTRGPLVSSAGGGTAETFTAAAMVSQVALPADLAIPPTGQCRLAVSSTTQLVLSPFQGNLIPINGVLVAIPAAGVASPSGISPASGAVYYVYAYLSAGALVLELSQTGHATGAYGHETKSGDATRTLVGMVYTNGSGQFVDSTVFRGCLNWFNRRRIQGAISVAGAATASTTVTGLAGSVTLLTWADEALSSRISGYCTSTTAGAVGDAYNYVDGAQQGSTGAGTVPAANQVGGIASEFMGNVSEGAHTLQPVGFTNGISTTFYLTLVAEIRG